MSGVYPLKNNEVAELSAEDIVNIMKYSGFSDKEIIRLGTDLRNCLAQSGAANVKFGNITESIFAVQSTHIQVSTRERGAFVYNLETKEIR